MYKRNKVNKKNGKIKVINILLLLIALVFVGILSTKVLAKEEKPKCEYIVTYNDTLWSISKNICSKSKNKNLNIQKIIYELKDINNLTDSDIYVGQKLILPIYE